MSDSYRLRLSFPIGLTVPWAAYDLDPQTDSTVVLAIWIDADLRGENDWLQGVLHLAVSVDVAGQDLRRIEDRVS